MLPIDITDDHRAYWREFETKEAIFGPPEEIEVGIEPCTAIITAPKEPADLNMACVRVPWKPDEADIAMIAAGGTIWLSTWGGLPPHMLEVQPPSSE